MKLLRRVQRLNFIFAPPKPFTHLFLEEALHFTTFSHATKHQRTDRKAYAIRVSVFVHVAGLSTNEASVFYKFVRLIPETVKVSVTYSSATRKLEVTSWTSPRLSRCLPCSSTPGSPSSGLVVFAQLHNGNATVVNCKRQSLHQ